MEKKSISILDDHLVSLQGMQEAGTDDFFYTRLKAKMTARAEGGLRGWSLPLKPIWVAASLSLLLIINGVMLSKQLKSKSPVSNNNSSLQGFAESYDQTISTSY